MVHCAYPRHTRHESYRGNELFAKLLRFGHNPSRGCVATPRANNIQGLLRFGVFFLHNTDALGIAWFPAPSICHSRIPPMYFKVLLVQDQTLAKSCVSILKRPNKCPARALAPVRMSGRSRAGRQYHTHKHGIHAWGAGIRTG